MLQKRNIMPAALSMADIMFTIRATFSGDANSENTFAVSIKNGAPGG